MKKLLSISIAISTFVLSACSTVTPEQRLQYNQAQKSLHNSTVSILSMACVVKIEVGKNPILFQQAEATARQTSGFLKQALELKQLSVNKQLSPLVCGTFKNKTTEKMTIRYTANGEREQIKSIPILSTGNSKSEQTNNAYANLFRALNKLSQSSPSTKTAIEISDSDAELLEKEFESDKTFVLISVGKKASFAVNMLVALPTAIATGGAYYSAMPVGNFYSIYLIDMKNKQVEWIKPQTYLPGKIMKMPVSIKRIPNILSPLYETK